MSADRIAIVGLACRYPDAATPEQLWQNVLARRRAFRRIPECRLGAGYHDVDAPDATYLTRAAVLRDWTFDRERFGVPGPLYRAADHTHWLALETAAAALADAGLAGGDGLDRDTTGVVLGNSLAGEFSRAGMLRLRWPFLADAAATALAEAGLAEDTAAEVLTRLEALVKEPFPVPGDESLSGALANTIAGRVCNYFDFHGTGYTVDGACSSSLLAVTAACRALTAGECDFMLAGGVDLSLDPLELVGFSRLGALADGDMRVYDASPTGFLPGEGCGVVALMRACDAEKRGLRAYAHIIGWASSSDGSGGLTRPELSGQALALHRAYRAAGIAPEQARLVEGHGTGTAIGDRVELSALSSVRGPDALPAALGSIKANVGHTKAAAGAASLIKATLATHHRVLPPTTGCERPHDLLRDAPLRVLAEAEPWPDETPRAGVSAMGFGGINVHVILEDPAPRSASASADGAWSWSMPRGRYQIVPLSASTPDGLAASVSALAEAAMALSVAEVGDVAATAWHSGAGDGPFRAMLVAAAPDELAAAAHAAATAAAGWDGGFRFDQRAGYALGSGDAVRVGLLFPGQAAPVRPDLPWWTRALDVLALPPEVDASDVTTEAARPAPNAVAPTEVAQPAIVRQSLAALAWLDAMGCEAVGGCGHSLGEITGLHWAGACSTSTALALANRRGRLMAEHALGGTTMAGLATSAAEAGGLLAGTDAVLACYNAPGRVVVAGPVDDVARVLDRAHAKGVAASRLPVSHAFHSPAMEPVAAPLRAALDDVALDDVDIERPLLSTVTGALVTGGGDALRGLLVDQLTKPVRFAEAIAELAARCDLLVEAGPGTMLSDLVAANDVDVPALSIDSGGDPRGHAFATAALAAGGNGALTPWSADRPYRTLDWRDTPQFLANPCETPRDRITAAPSSGTVGHAGLSAGHGVGNAGHGVPNAGHGVPNAGHGGEDTGPLEALTQHLATVLELPARAIQPSHSLLGELHMTSIQVVDAVGAVATRLGKQPPSTPLSLSDATVTEAAEVLAALPSATDTERPATPAGVRGWVRRFEPVWLPFDAPGTPGTAATATGTAATSGTTSVTAHDTLTVTLSHDAGPTDVAALLGEIARQRPRTLRIVHTGHPAAAGIGRSIAAEHTDCQVIVLERPDTATDPGDLGLGHPDRYLELRTRADGTLERAALRARPPQQDTDTPPLPDGVCLVTGGIRGITAYAAAELAAGTDCTLVFLGRTPADDPDVTAALHDLAASGQSAVRYLSCDVTDPGSVAAMLTEARVHGTVTGIIHGAGVNEPRPLDDVTAESFAATLAPKVDGLRTLLAALGDAAENLRLLLGFGSIIGRQGLAGQAEYCIANDWLRADVEAWARTQPHCRTHLLEWSVWSGVGMGVRLGVLDNLRRQGVEPIGRREGVDALREVLADPHASVPVLITARFPQTATMHVTGAPAPLLRFGEHVRARVPGVEAVTEAELSLGSDPYLDDHRIDGTPVLPAVVAMEAMVQAASHVNPTSSLPVSLTGLEFRAPITLSGPDPRTVQLAALSGRNGTDVVVRDDSDSIGSDRFSGTVVTAPAPPVRERPAEHPPPSLDAGPHECYETTFFHTGRFRRLLRYDLLSAFRVRAWIRAEQGSEAVPWFSPFHSGRLLLGDPGAHDATLHVLLACVPHRRALPVGVDRVTVWREPTGVLRVDAAEVSHTADDYVFDAVLSEPDGTVVARWQGLRLRATTPPQRQGTLPVRLVGPWLSRRFVECGLHDRLELVTAPGRRKFGAATGLLQQLTGSPTGHDLAGGPRVDGSHASASYAHNTLLLGVSDDPIGVDWESVPATPAHAGAVPCDAHDHPVAELLADKLGEDPTLARLRVWTAREALSKLGYGQAEPLRIDRITEDGLTILRAGADQVATAKVPTTDPRGTQVKVAAVACPRER